MLTDARKRSVPRRLRTNGDDLADSGADPGTLARMTNAGTEVLST